MIDQSKIDRVKAALNIKDVIGHDVIWAKEAKSYGGTLKSPCPFCGGTDRFHCHPVDGNWWCRQCGRKGDVFTYWVERYHVTFSEAVHALALSAGISLESAESAADSTLAQPAHGPAAEPAADSDALYLACHDPAVTYPKRVIWPDGEAIYHNGDQLYSDLWQRSMVKEALSLGGVAR